MYYGHIKNDYSYSINWCKENYYTLFSTSTMMNEKDTDKKLTDSDYFSFLGIITERLVKSYMKLIFNLDIKESKKYLHKYYKSISGTSDGKIKNYQICKIVYEMYENKKITKYIPIKVSLYEHKRPMYMPKQLKWKWIAQIMGNMACAEIYYTILQITTFSGTSAILIEFNNKIWKECIKVLAGGNKEFLKSLCKEEEYKHDIFSYCYNGITRGFVNYNLAVFNTNFYKEEYMTEMFKEMNKDLFKKSN